LDNNINKICSCKNGFYGSRCENSFDIQSSSLCTTNICSNGYIFIFRIHLLKNETIIILF
jgi:hypothetical protein